MSRFMAFVPDSFCTDPSGLNRLDAAGLGRLKGGAVFEAIDSGPNGSRGIFASWPKTGELRSEFAPDWQTWVPAVAMDQHERGRYWVGISTDDPPTSRDLALKVQSPGQAVVLGDGHDWTFPFAASLTMAFGYGPDGSIGTPPKAEMQAFTVVAQEIYSKLIAGMIGDDDVHQVIRLLVAGLSCNYGITPEVVSMLRLFNSENLTVPLYIAVEGFKLATIESIEADIRRANLPELTSEFAE